MRGRLLAGVLALGAVLLTAAPAAAHTEVVATSPRAGQVLSEAPDAVSVAFDDPVDLRTAQVRVLEPDGTPVEGLGRPDHAGGRDSTLAAALPPGLGDGTHTVVWRVAAGDGHPIQGSFTFSVGVAGPSAGAAGFGGGDPALRAAAGVARWAAFAGLALALGTAYVLAACWPGGAARARARRILWAGAGLLAAGTAAGLALQGPYVAGGTLAGAADAGALADTLGTRTGLLLAVRLGLLGALGAALAVALRRWASDGEVSRGRGAAVLAGGLTLAVTWSLATHTAAGPGLAVAVPVDAVHLVATGVWLGGLAVLLGALPWRDAPLAAVRRAVPAFSSTAAVCVAVLLTTGCYQAWRQVGSPAALETTYGGILLAKVVGVAVLVALGARARAWVASRAGAGRAVGDGRRPRPGLQGGGTATLVRPATDFRLSTTGNPPGEHVKDKRKSEVAGFRRLLALEAGIGAVVLGLTAALVSVQPARTSHAAAQAAAHVGALGAATPVAEATDVALGLGLRKDGTTAAPDDSAASGWVNAVISPAANGLPNEVHVSVVDPGDRPIALQGIGIDLRKRGSDEASQQYPLLPSGPGHYFASFVLPAAGSWDLGLLVVAEDGRADLVLLPVEAHLPEE